MPTFKTLLWSLAAGATLSTSCFAAQLTIPGTHPRLFYGNATRLQQARTYYQGNPFTPASGDASELNGLRALRALMTNDTPLCNQAATHLVNWDAATQGNFRDAIRQQGDSLLQIYDWCHGSLSAGQINTLVARWNGYMDRENCHPSIPSCDNFANQGSEANNYYWGRVRNNLMWGIASFGDNPRAQEYIDNALDTRLGMQFAGWYANFGRGGVFPEGGDYGVVMLSYPIIPFQSAADFGYDPYNSTAFFREAIYAVIYGTTPGPTPFQSSPGQSGHLLFPFNDDEHFRDGGVIGTRDYLGDFARFMGYRNPTSGNARHMRAYLTQTNAGRRWMFDALGGTGTVSDLNALPLDYYAPGAQVLYARTGFDANATAVHMQIGTPGGVEHRHLDASSFQMWRKGRWITRESVGYAEQIAGFNGTASVDTDRHMAHNGLQFQGRTTGRWVGSGPIVIPPGQDRGDNPLGLPEVKRVHHHDGFMFLAVDYSKAYRNTTGTRVDWPYADKAVREYLFIRQLGALLIFDRTRTSSDSQLAFYGTANWVERNDPLAVRVPAAQVTRTFIMHFETSPTATGNRLSATVGTQIADLVTLRPASPTFRVINEDCGGCSAQAGQFRAEIDSVGSADSYFINVVSGRDTAEQPIAAAVTEDGTSFVVQLTHPTRGSATVTLMKGMESLGGSLVTSGGVNESLLGRVQGITVTESGPEWEPNDVLLRDGFE